MHLWEVLAVSRGAHREPRDVWVIGCAFVVAVCGIGVMALLGWVL